MRLLVLCLGFVLLASSSISAQDSRSRYTLPKHSRNFAKALKNGTRTEDGKPGLNYWTNTARYKIEASLDPATAIVSGSTLIRYRNNSPKKLRTLRLHLRQNLHKENSPRSSVVEITGGVKLGAVSVLDPTTMKAIDGIRRQRVLGTIYTVSLKNSVAPGAEVVLSIEWSYKIPKVGAPRNGRIGEDLFYLAYWYPQLAVYDDVEGWVADKYLGSGEFYMGYADYDVAFTVPENFLVRATGKLVNAKNVLSARTLRRLKKSRRAKDIVNIVTAEESGKPGIMATGKNGQLTWHFKAQNVRDFAIGCGNDYLWDATHAKVGGGKPDCMIHAVYRPAAQRGWRGAADYARHTIEFMSKHVFPYPYPHVSACEGASGGGMEFPMMTTIRSGNRKEAVHGVVTHELIHMWFPMIAGSNEKRYAWMDEGMTSAFTALASNDYWQRESSDEQEIAQYAALAGRDWEKPTMTHGDHFGPNAMAYGIATYAKTSAVFLQLKAMLGDKVFYQTLQEYVAHWAFKHPRPEDLFASFSRTSKKNLDWYFRTWFFETWALDQSILKVEFDNGKTIVTVADYGTATGPTTIEASMADGKTQRKTIPVSLWMQGERTATVEFDGEATSVMVDPDRCAVDSNRRNDRWKK